MNCKNCGTLLASDDNYCQNCGAKIIRNRLTFKHLINEFFERFFNLDNTFFRTVWHMIIKPQEVGGGYISGLRKRYLNPVSMLAIALTFSGFIMFLIKKMVWDSIDFSTISYLKTSANNGTEKIMSSSMEYSSLMYFLYIPIIAFASFAAFNKKNYNYSEHIVLSIYSLTSFSIISILYTIVLLIVNPQLYFNTALLYMLVMISFCMYVAYKNSVSNIKSLFWRIPVFFIIVLIGYFGVSIISFFVLLMTGEISIQDFIPKK